MHEQFGRYQLLERIAIGGMAEIFKAKAPGLGGFEKILAIKRLHPRYSQDADFIEMLIDEARITVELSHSNIGQIFDLGKVDDHYFIAMEYIDGRDLYRVLKRLRDRDERMPIDAAAYVTMEACAGLDYAHRKKDGRGRPLHIVHRDMSPQNVLLSFEGEVKIVDFGIAKAALRAYETEAGIIKGKFYYMSPEQARGEPLDHRTDIFSLGIVLYEMLTGELLYKDDDEVSLLSRVRRAEIDPPSVSRPQVPPVLDRIVMRALARERGDRFPSAQHMQRELARFLRTSEVAFNKARLSQVMRDLFTNTDAGDATVPVDPIRGRDEMGPDALSVISVAHFEEGDDATSLEDGLSDPDMLSGSDLLMIETGIEVLDDDDTRGDIGPSSAYDDSLDIMSSVGDDFFDDEPTRAYEGDRMREQIERARPAVEPARPVAPGPAAPRAQPVLAQPAKAQVRGQGARRQPFGAPEAQQPAVVVAPQRPVAVAQPAAVPAQPAYQAPPHRAPPAQPVQVQPQAVPVVAQPVVAQPVVAQPVQAQPMHPGYAAQGQQPYGQPAPFGQAPHPGYGMGHPGHAAPRAVAVPSATPKAPEPVLARTSAMAGVHDATFNRQETVIVPSDEVGPPQRAARGASPRAARNNRRPQASPTMAATHLPEDDKLITRERLLIAAILVLVVLGTGAVTTLLVNRSRDDGPAEPTVVVADQTEQAARPDPPAVPEPETPKTATLRFTTQPAEAGLQIDGKYVVRDGDNAPIEVKAGVPVRLRVAAPGFVAYETQLTLEPGESRRVDARLERLTGTLVIETRPSGATVFVAGKEQGTSPLTLNQVPLDRDTPLRIEKDGYEPVRRAVAWDPAGQRQKSLEIALTSKPVKQAPKRTRRTPRRTRTRTRARRSAPAASGGTGFLSVSSRQWGSVFVNRAQVAVETPLLKYKLPAGRHRVHVCYAGDRSRCTPSKTVTIKPGESSVVRF